LAHPVEYLGTIVRSKADNSQVE